MIMNLRQLWPRQEWQTGCSLFALDPLLDPLLDHLILDLDHLILDLDPLIWIT